MSSLSRPRPPLVIQTCIDCGIDFAISHGLYEIRRRDGEAYSCPNGHRQCFVTDEEKEERARKDFSAADYAENAALRSQVKYLSQSLKDAQLALKAAAASPRKGRAQAGPDAAKSRHS